MEAALFMLAMLTGFAVVAAVLWWIGPKEPADDPDDTAW